MTKSKSGRAIIRSFSYPVSYQPQIDKLIDTANKRGISISQMIISMIDAYLAEKENNNNSNNKTGKIWVQ